MIENSIGQQEEVTTLEDYLEAVKNRKWVVVATALTMFLLALALTSRQTPVYEASGTLEVLPSRYGSPNGNPVNPNMNLESEKVVSDDVKQVVALELEEKVQNLAGAVNVAYLPTSQVLFLDATDPSPERAQALVNEFMNAYVDQRVDADKSVGELNIASIEAAIEGTNTQIAAKTAEIEQVINDIRRFSRDTSLTQAQRDARIDQLQIERTNLQTDINTFNASVRTQQTRLTTEKLAQSSGQPAAAVIREAVLPTNARGIPSSAVLLASLIAGTLFGTALAFLIERLDATARDESDVALALGVKVLGSIPTFGMGNRNGPSAAVMLVNDRKPRLAEAREAIRRLRSSLQFSAASGENEGQVFLMTSAFPGEGKSVVTTNLAAALAQSGKKVALVNADMRRPTLEKLLNLPNVDGLSNFLTGREEVMNLREVQGVPGLYFVPAGPPPANPGELLGSPQFERLVKDLRSHADFVLIDSPPVLSTADAVTASRYADGVVVVVDSRRTETSDLLRVRDDLDRAGAPLIGAVLNKVRTAGGLFSRRDAYAYYGTGQS